MNITFENLTKRYGKKAALTDFSATLTPGVIGLLGANGAGKSTLLNLFVGGLKGDGGRILVDGVDVKKLGRRFLSYLGYMPQYPTFYQNFTVLEFLRYLCAVKDIPAKIGEARARELLDIVNLSDGAEKKIGALSGGMRQRVGIAQAMLGDPKILVLDEPTAGLDPRERIRFRNLISRFSDNRIILLATHIVPDIEFIAEQVLLLKEGRLLRQGSPAALTAEIEGKVWQFTTTQESRFRDMKISNMHRNGKEVLLRILSDTPPTENGALVPPSLEDVFLYHCGEGEL